MRRLKTRKNLDPGKGNEYIRAKKTPFTARRGRKYPEHREGNRFMAEILGRCSLAASIPFWELIVPVPLGINPDPPAHAVIWRPLLCAMQFAVRPATSIDLYQYILIEVYSLLYGLRYCPIREE